MKLKKMAFFSFVFLFFTAFHLQASDGSADSEKSVADLKSERYRLQQEITRLTQELNDLEGKEQALKDEKEAAQEKQAAPLDVERDQKSSPFGFRRDFQDIQKHLNEMNDRLNQVMEHFPHHSGFLKMPSIKYRSLSHSSGFNQVIKKEIIQNGKSLKIEILSQNGERVVNIEKEGKVLAEQLPWDQLDTLPEEIQSEVKSMVLSSNDLKSFAIEDDFFDNKLNFKIEKKSQAGDRLRKIEKRRKRDERNRF